MTRTTAVAGAVLEKGGITAVFDHAAVAARSIRQLLPVYANLLGGKIVNGGDNARIGYRALQLAYPDGSKIELMEPLDGSTFFDRFLARGGGLHHVTFKVVNIVRAIELLGDLGLTPTSTYLDEDDWKEVFLHPREASGVLVQLAQAAPSYLAQLADVTIEAVLAGQGNRGNGVASP